MLEIKSCRIPTHIRGGTRGCNAVLAHIVKEEIFDVVIGLARARGHRLPAELVARYAIPVQLRRERCINSCYIGEVVRLVLKRFLPGQRRFHRALAAHHAGNLTGQFLATPADLPRRVNTQEQLSIHFWTPHAWPSTVIHVDRILPQLRLEASGLGLQWKITSGPELPRHPVDWLICLKAVPPSRNHAAQTVLLFPDDADRVWRQLQRFDHIIVPSSPVLASLIGSQHQRVWFMEETEAIDAIALGESAIEQLPPSKRTPILLWHGLREGLDGLFPLRDTLDAFAQKTDTKLVVVTNRAETTEQWGALSVRYVAWSPQTLAAMASQARLGIVPARPTLANSYLKSAGRVRRLFALGCPAIGDARSPDVVDFSRACDVPSATTPAEWLTALRQLWREPARLDEAVRCGHALVRERYSAPRTARQWISFFCAAGKEVG